MKKNPQLGPLILGGALGAFLGTLLAHALVMAAQRTSPEAGLWLKGPYGPPFFNLWLASSVFYAGIGAGLFRGKERLQGAGIGFGVPMFGILLPMILATRLFSWGEGSSEPTMAWMYLILAVYTGSCASAVWLLGLLCRAGGRRFDWRTAFAGLVGMGAAYGVGRLMNGLFPPYASIDSAMLLPPASVTLDGIFTGTLIGAAIAYSAAPRGKIEAPSPAEGGAAAPAGKAVATAAPHPKAVI